MSEIIGKTVTLCPFTRTVIVPASPIIITTASKSSDAEVRLMSLVHNSVWSDEVEVIAKAAGYMASILLKKHIKWEGFLPTRFIRSATLPRTTAKSAVAQSRALMPILDAFVRANSGNLK